MTVHTYAAPARRGRQFRPGDTFGHLTVITSPFPRSPWVGVRCACGTWKLVRAQALPKRDACAHRCPHARAAARQRATRHGMDGTPTYDTWRNMIKRCTDPGHRSYPDYGGRGITVCERWRDFAAFHADMGARPDGLTLDRVNNEGNYEPGNCKWSTVTEQNRNKRPERLRDRCRAGHIYRPGTWRWRTDSSERARRCLICKAINEGRVAE